MSKVKKTAHSSEQHSSSSCSSSSLSSDEEVNTQDLKPIKEYLANRRELARQLFKSVKTEKIRMMLPQTLKKVDLNELEEWCASELNGMSKTRILCILNGKTMLESSDTSQSDDSGPSLEIISDTEEWFTDDDASRKEDGTPSDKTKIKKDKVKLKGKSQIHKRDDADKLKMKSKPISKDRPDNKSNNKKIKKEDEKETSKEKEGDSLLDLLELEMRARAIRALIRKEEDILPASNASKSTETNETSEQNNVSKTTSDELRAKEKCRRQLEKIISAQRAGTAEDEDVVLVIQPTPTIELLSSESDEEAHSGTRVNQRLENERVLETEKSHVENGNVKNTHSTNLENIKKNRRMHKDSDTRKQEGSKRIYSSTTENKNVQSSSSTKTDSGTEKRRKLKRKSHAKDQSNTCDSEKDSMQLEESNTNKTVETVSQISSTDVNENAKSPEIDECKPQDIIESVTEKESVTVEQNDIKVQDIPKSVAMDDEKSIDLEEIIDLDDYCDDMDDMENLDNDNNKKKQINENQQPKASVETPPAQKSNSTETWASRYYQTDDVQNVIKESKIQSEIRKRLRERQRLSKLNKSPSSGSISSSSATEATTNKSESNPMGSVHEYLALKRSTSATLSSCSDNNSTNETQNTDVSNDTCAPIITENIGNLPSDADKQINLNDSANTETPLLLKEPETVNKSNDGNPD